MIAQTVEEYNAQHKPYTVEYNPDNGGWDVLFHGEWLETASTYSDADAIIDAHIARRQADERAAAEWSEQRHHGA